MDSLSQIALGAALGVAVMGRRTAVWKAALWGGVAGTLPDLDALIDHGDAVLNMTLHRAESHSLFLLTLAAPLLAGLLARWPGDTGGFRRWCLALWLALFTHPLLDTFTVYGTQLLQPFSDYPFGIGSMFIIDPLYTLPLLLGLGLALVRAEHRGLRANWLGLALSTAYLGWSLVAQQQATQVARASLAQQGQPVQGLLVTPAPFNTVLWRLLAVTPTHYLEAYHSLLDDGQPLTWTVHERGAALMAEHRNEASVARIAAFSHGFYSLAEQDGRLILTDLRMGQEPAYVFRFDLGTASQRAEGMRPVQMTLRPDLDTALPWLWQRMLGRIQTPLSAR